MDETNFAGKLYNDHIIIGTWLQQTVVEIISIFHFNTRFSQKLIEFIGYSSTEKWTIL